MSNHFRKAELQQEIIKRGIELDPEVKWTNDNLIKKLGKHWLSTNKQLNNWGLSYVHSLENLMLCKHYKDEIKFFNSNTDPLESPDWIAEMKENGFRFIMTHTPAEGLSFYSRNTSVDTFLNGVFTDKILFFKQGIFKTPSSFKSPYTFVAEGEITVNTDSLELDGVTHLGVEDFVQAILGSSSTRAKQIQKEGVHLRFTLFDILYLSKNEKLIPPQCSYNFKETPVSDIPEEDLLWIEKRFEKYLATSGFVNLPEGSSIFDIPVKKRPRKKAKKLYSYLYSLKDTPKEDLRLRPFATRRKLRDSLTQYLSEEHNLPFYLIEFENDDKIDMLEQVLREGKEGIILKNLNAPYISALKSSRSHKAELKIKTSIRNIINDREGVLEDFDVFVSGCNQPKSKDHKDKKMLGSLKCSVILLKEDGTEVEHEIANIASLPHYWKKELVYEGEGGLLQIKPEYMGKVISIDGMAISHKTLRFHHAVLKEKDLVFKPKDALDCTITEEELRGKILTRGN